MIVVMKEAPNKAQIDRVIEHIEELGLRSHVIEGTELTVVAALGEKRDGAKQALETLEGVEKVVPILAPYKMASTEVKKEPTVVASRGLRVGGGQLGVIAGPCSVEGREQILEVAHVVKEAGAAGLRGGAFKPRTSPYSFQGLKEKGLELLAEAREATGLAVVTEIMAKEHVELVSRYADVLQVGARNMQNYPLLEAVGESSLPVLLEARPVGDDGRVLAGGRVHPQDRQLASDAVRARHPHFRGPHTVHAAAGERAVPAPAHAFAGRGRSQSRHGQGKPGVGDGAGVGGGGRGRPDRRNAPQSGQGAERRLSIADAGRFPSDDGGVSQDRARAGNADVTISLV